MQNVTAADNGATVQCHILNNMELSNIITLSIRKCKANVAINKCVTVHQIISFLCALLLLQFTYCVA